MGMWGVTNVAGNLSFYALSAYLYYGLGITWRICFGICLAVHASVLRKRTGSRACSLLGPQLDGSSELDLCPEDHGVKLVPITR